MKLCKGEVIPKNRKRTIGWHWPSYWQVMAEQAKDITVEDGAMTEIGLKALSVLRNPWLWDEKTLEWARREAEITCINHCQHHYDECNGGCCYPGRCGRDFPNNSQD